MVEYYSNYWQEAILLAVLGPSCESGSLWTRLLCAFTFTSTRTYMPFGHISEKKGHCHVYLQTCVTNNTNIFRLAPNLTTSIYVYIYKSIPKKAINIWNESGELNFLRCRRAFGRTSEIFHPTKLASRKLRL
jgi:hypothetical protein